MDYNILENSSKIAIEGPHNDYIFQNFFLDDDGVLRQFLGYRKVFDENFSRIIKKLVDRDGRNIFLITKGAFLILNNKFQIIYNVSWNGSDDIGLYSIVEDVFGNIIATNGRENTIYLFKIVRDGDYFIIDDKIKYLDKIKNPCSLEYIDGKIFCVDRYTGKFFRIVDIFLDDLEIFDFAIQSIPCSCVALIRIKRLLCAIGTKCVELWYSDDSVEGISRYNNQLIEFGTTEPNSCAVVNGKLLFVCSNENSGKSILMFDPYRQSETFIENNNIPILFERYELLNGWAFSWNNIEFYLLNFAEKTVLFNIDTGNFSFLSNDGGRFYAEDIFFFNGKHYFIGNDSNSVLCELSKDIIDYNGAKIPLLIQTSPLKLDSKQENFFLEAIDFGVKPLLNNNIIIDCAWNSDFSDNRNFTEYHAILHTIQNVAYITNTLFPKGRKILQLKFSFKSNKIVAIDTFLLKCR